MKDCPSGAGQTAFEHHRGEHPGYLVIMKELVETAISVAPESQNCIIIFLREEAKLWNIVKI